MRKSTFLFVLKVWAGNENCEDVTWQECKLVETKVNFTVPKVDCQETGNIIPYMRFENTDKTEMLTKMTCEGSDIISPLIYVIQAYVVMGEIIDAIILVTRFISI